MTKKDKAFYMGKLVTLLGFMHDVLPILVFAYVYRYFGFLSPSFTWAGLTAFVFLGLLYFVDLKVERFMLGVNIFLFTGAILLRFGPDKFVDFFLNNLQTSLFVFVFVIGLLLTFYSKKGFVGFEDVKPQARVARLSYFLLGAVAVAAVVSFYFSTDMVTGTLVPWIGLFGFRRLLK